MEASDSPSPSRTRRASESTRSNSSSFASNVSLSASSSPPVVGSSACTLIWKALPLRLRLLTSRAFRPSRRQISMPSSVSRRREESIFIRCRASVEPLARKDVHETRLAEGGVQRLSPCRIEDRLFGRVIQIRDQQPIAFGEGWRPGAQRLKREDTCHEHDGSEQDGASRTPRCPWQRGRRVLGGVLLMVGSPPQHVQVVEQVSRLLVALLGVFREGLAHDALELSGDRRVQTADRLGVAVQRGVQHFAARRPAERAEAGAHLVDDGAEGEQVGATVHRSAEALLGRHVAEGADDLSGIGQLRAVRVGRQLLRHLVEEHSCEPEVREQGLTIMVTITFLGLTSRCRMPRS